MPGASQAPGGPHPHFNHPDSDFTIRVTIRSTGICTEFRVHKASLASASIFFRDLFEIGDKTKPLKEQSVIDVESARPSTWPTLLGTLYGNHTFFETNLSDQSTDRTLTLRACWNVAYKYQFKTVQLYCDLLLRDAIRATASIAPAKPALELYQRAKVIQSTIVEQAAFEWLGRVNHAYPCRIAMLDQLNVEEQNRLLRTWLANSCKREGARAASQHEFTDEAAVIGVEGSALPSGMSLNQMVNTVTTAVTGAMNGTPSGNVSSTGASTGGPNPAGVSVNMAHIPGTHGAAAGSFFMPNLH